MELRPNEGKALTVRVNGGLYARYAIRTHFVQVGESFTDLVERYVKPVYRPGDIVSVSEKVVALCQGRIVTEDQAKPGLWAKILSRFVHQTAAGPGMGLPVKMQFAIDRCGLGAVLKAAVCAGADKLRGVHGTFYDMLDPEVRGLDGFFGRDIPEYAHIGIRIPSEPDRVCDQVYEKTGVVMMIVDANDLTAELLGRGRRLRDWTVSQLLALIRDNPGGQDRQLTPFILIRKAE